MPKNEKYELVCSFFGSSLVHSPTLSLFSFALTWNSALSSLQSLSACLHVQFDPGPNFHPALSTHSDHHSCLLRSRHHSCISHARYCLPDSFYVLACPRILFFHTKSVGSLVYFWRVIFGFHLPMNFVPNLRGCPGEVGMRSLYSLFALPIRPCAWWTLYPFPAVWPTLSGDTKNPTSLSQCCLGPVLRCMPFDTSILQEITEKK